MSFFIKTTEGLERLNGVYIKPSTAEKTITANGTYDASDDGVDGYSSVTVNVPTIIPDDIVLLEYIKSQKNAAIKTDIVTEYSNEIACELAFDSESLTSGSSDGVFGVQSSGAWHMFSRNNDGCGWYIGYMWDASGTHINNVPTSQEYTRKNAVWLRQPSSGYGVSLGISVSSQTTQSAPVVPMSIFGATTTSGNTAIYNYDNVTIYGLKVYDQGKLIHNLLPAKKNNSGGFFDVCTGKFYGKTAGDGDIICGAPIVTTEEV
jgi:hypothetical protein